MKINAEKQVIKQWLELLSEASRGKKYPKLWKRVYRLVAVPARTRKVVNLTKLEKYTKDGDNVIVPGKVLSNGVITHKLKIAAIEFSEPALKNLKEANCKIVDLKDMLAAEKVHIIV
ncbi:MAG: 50S ribosomal protein L18e [Candidatus Micrarchaeaceae archaeon]|jgi:large subunit ribosomal protein L18e